MRIEAVNRVYDSYSTQALSNVKSTEQLKGRDELNLSSQGKDIAKIKKMLEEVPEVREDKVQAIKEKMDNGTYNVSSKDVASKILSRY